MADIWVLGWTAWDVVYRVPRVPEAGGAVRMCSKGRRVGGSTGNVACGLASAGHHVHLVAAVADDEAGCALLTELEELNVDVSHATQNATLTPWCLLLVDDNGERTVLYETGTRPALSGPGPEALRDANLVMVGQYKDYLPGLAQQLAESGVCVVTAVPRAGAEWYANVIVGSASEFDATRGDDLYSAYAAQAGDRLRAVVRTLGSGGVDIFEPGRITHLDAEPVDMVRDLTGAGDSFAAGLCHGLVSGWTVERSAQLGCHWAAVAVSLEQSVPPRFDSLTFPE